MQLQYGMAVVWLCWVAALSRCRVLLAPTCCRAGVLVAGVVGMTAGAAAVARSAGAVQAGECSGSIHVAALCVGVTAAPLAARLCCALRFARLSLLLQGCMLVLLLRWHLWLLWRLALGRAQTRSRLSFLTRRKTFRWPVGISFSRTAAA